MRISDVLTKKVLLFTSINCKCRDLGQQAETGPIRMMRPKLIQTAGNNESGLSWRYGVLMEMTF